MINLKAILERIRNILRRDKQVRHVSQVIAETGFRLPQGLCWELKEFPGPSGNTQLLVASRYDQLGYTNQIARGLLIDVDCGAKDVDDAAAIARNEAELLLPPLSLAANAWYGDPEVLIAYDKGAGKKHHPLLFNILPEAFQPFPQGGRELEVDLAHPVLEAMFTSEKGIRLHRAMVYYNEALLAWETGKELRAVESLFVAAETLAPVALESAIHKRGGSKERLAKEWKVQGPKCPNCSHTWVRDGDLTSAARVHVVFAGDKKTAQTTRKVSDGLEHGFADLPELHRLAKSCRDAAAGHVRRAILSLLDLPPELIKKLTNNRYERPLRRDAVRRTYRMVLTGAADRLAPKGQAHPVLQPSFSIKDAKTRVDGSGDLTITDSIKVQFGEGTSAKHVATGFSDRATSSKLVDVRVIKGDSRTAKKQHPDAP